MAMGQRGLRGRLLVLVLTLAAPVLAGCAGSEVQSKSPETSSESQSPSVEEHAAADLGAPPDGRYEASYMLESSNVPGVKKGFRSTSTYAFTFDDCSETKCWGTVKAPAEGSYEWDGTELVVSFDQMKKTEHCVDDSGNSLEQATIDGTTEHEARLIATEGSDSAPMRLEGTYEQSTVYGNSRNGCHKAGPDRQQARFSLVLERK